MYCKNHVLFTDCVCYPKLHARGLDQDAGIRPKRFVTRTYLFCSTSVLDPLNHLLKQKHAFRVFLIHLLVKVAQFCYLSLPCLKMSITSLIFQDYRQSVVSVWKLRFFKQFKQYCLPTMVTNFSKFNKRQDYQFYAQFYHYFQVRSFEFIWFIADQLA